MTRSSQLLTRKPVNILTCNGRFSDLPRQPAPSRPFFTGTVAWRADDQDPKGSGLTAAGTVRDFHPVPYYFFSSKCLRTPSQKQKYGLYRLKSHERKKNIHRLMNVIFINLRLKKLKNLPLQILDPKSWILDPKTVLQMKRILRIVIMLLVISSLTGITSSCVMFQEASHVEKLKPFKHSKPLPKKYIIDNGYKPIAK